MSSAARPHTGRQRNTAVRQAILDASLRLFTSRPAAEVTMAAIAAEAGSGKQTLYRWWPSPYAILLEAAVEMGRSRVPMPDKGNLRDDLRAFVTSTFAGARDAQTVGLLRVLAAEAQRDADASSMLREFTDRRRDSLRAVFERGLRRGELDAGSNIDLLIDQVFGVLWYRILFQNGPLSDAAARELAEAVLQ